MASRGSGWIRLSSLASGHPGPRRPASASAFGLVDLLPAFGPRLWPPWADIPSPASGYVPHVLPLSTLSLTTRPPYASLPPAHDDLLKGRADFWFLGILSACLGHLLGLVREGEGEAVGAN